MDRIATIYGKPIEELTKEELIEAINLLAQYYETRIEGLQKALSLGRRGRFKVA